MSTPRLQDYFGVWAMEERALHALEHRGRGLDIEKHLAGPAPKAAMALARRGTAAVMDVQDGVAVLSVFGLLMKAQPSLAEGTSTVLLRQALREAARDPQVTSILLRIESPGGTVAGIDDLAADIRRARKHKPVIAYIEDIGASAAYWLASQADSISVNRSAMIGSIGVFSVVLDRSKQAEQDGVKVHVIRAGEFKGAGEPGTEITDKQLAEFQRTIDGVGMMFREAVGTGRKLSGEALDAVCDGRVHLASEAMALGLIDDIQSFDNVLEMLRSGAALPAHRGTEIDEMAAATLAELKQAIPGASASFLMAQLEAGASVIEAQRARIAQLQAKKSKAEAEEDDDDPEAEEDDDDETTAKRKRKMKAQARPGVAPVTGRARTSFAGDTGEQVEELIATHRAATGCDRATAMRAICTRHPELRAQWVAEHNAHHGHGAVR